MDSLAPDFFFFLVHFQFGEVQLMYTYLEMQFKYIYVEIACNKLRKVDKLCQFQRLGVHS